jgi:hypothetical protein
MLAALAAVALLLALPPAGHALDLRVLHVPSADSGLRHISAGPDGALWFTEFAPGTLAGAGCCGAYGTIVGGVAHIWPLGSQAPVDGFEPHSLTLGPDGGLWFAVWKTWSRAQRVRRDRADRPGERTRAARKPDAVPTRGHRVRLRWRAVVRR